MEVNALVIKNLRTDRSWTQQHLAEACAISLRTVQRVERYGNTSKETVMSLAAVFEVEQSIFVVPDEPVEVVKQVVGFGKNKNKNLIMTTLIIGMMLGANIMFFINMLIN
jgi:transcriptional regulator with XRE-family HTH domain